MIIHFKPKDEGGWIKKAVVAGVIASVVLAGVIILSKRPGPARFKKRKIKMDKNTGKSKKTPFRTRKIKITQL